MFRGELLKAFRKRRGCSQKELSRLSGVAVNTISEAERGNREPHGSTLAQLAKVLDVRIASFYEGTTKGA